MLARAETPPVAPKWPWPSTVEKAVEESVAALSATDVLGFFKHVCAEMADVA